MRQRRRAFTIVTALFMLLFPSGLPAQVILDGTLGAAGPLAGPHYAVTGNLGRQVGGNLFHSFSSFSIYRNESATFSGPSSVQNIISRVTGGNASYIDGLLRSTIPGANLFFINPGGVMFGPHASLDVSGSFHVSTADYLKLGQNGRFDALNPAADVLTVDPPTAFGFLSATPAGVSVDQGFLAVPPGKTLSLIGGDVEMYNGVLNAPGGTINLVATASAGEVAVGSGAPVPTGFTALGTITLYRDTYRDDSSDVDASGTGSAQGGGSVFIRGGRFLLLGGRVAATTGHLDAAGGIHVGAGEDVRLDGNGVVDGGALWTWSSGDGRGGDVTIATKRLDMTGGASVNTTALGNGSGGGIYLTATESVTVDQGNLLANTFFDGQGGAVVIAAPEATITKGAQIQSATLGAGSAGGVRFQVDSLRITDGVEINTSTYGSGAGGPIAIDAARSVTIGGSQLLADAFSSGRGRGIAISAPTVTLNGAFLESKTEGTGDAGAITVNAGDLTMTDWARMVTGTLGAGSGGTIAINADTVMMTGYGTGPIAYADGDDCGDAGDIIIRARSVSLADWASVNTSIKGRSNGGNMVIDADAVFIDEWARVIAYTDGSGAGGNIAINGSVVAVSGYGSVKTVTWGSGNAGSITVNGGSLSLAEGGNIMTSAYGTGHGNITVNATESVAMSRGSVTTEPHEGGVSGTIDITTPVLTLDHGAEISSSPWLLGSGTPGAITLRVGRLLLTGGSTITSSSVTGDYRNGDITIFAGDRVEILGRGSSIFSGVVWADGDGGDIRITTPSLVVDGGQIAAGTNYQGRAGTINLTVGTLTLRNGGQVMVSTDGSGSGGAVTVTATDGVTISGTAEGQYPSGLFADTHGSGTGGSIALSAPSLSILDGGTIRALTTWDGKAGNVDLTVGSLTIAGGGTIMAPTTGGSGSGGAVTITAAESVTITGAGGDGWPSGVYADTYIAGKGGDITIATPQLAVHGGLIWANTLGEGAAGTVTLNVGTLTLSGGGQVSTSTAGTGEGGPIMVSASRSVSAADPLSGFFASTQETSSGKGGSITITTPLLRLDKGAEIQAVTWGTGRAGDITLQAERIHLSGDGSYVVTDTVGAGRAGTITVDGGAVILTGGAAIMSGTSGGGGGGSILLKATRSLALSGANEDFSSWSGLFVNTYSGGDGGTISVSTPTLTLSDCAMIQAVSSETATGNAGNIDLDVGSLSVTTGAQIAAATLGPGRGGAITVRARDSVSLSGAGHGSPSLLSAQTLGEGDAGRVMVSAPSISISDGASVGASTGGPGRAGEVLLKGDVISLERGGRISTSTRATGQGGNITVEATQLTLTGGSTIASESTGTGLAGDITLTVGDLIQLRGSSLTTATEDADGGNIRIDPRLLRLTDSSITATVKGGTGNGGNIDILARTVILDHSAIIANAEFGNGGNIDIASTVFLASPDSTVSASSRFGLQGTVEISAPYVDLVGNMADLPESLLNIDALLPKPCVESAEEASSFVVRGRDGLPPQPDSLLPSLPPTAPGAVDSRTGDAPDPLSARLLTGRMADAMKKGDFQGAVDHGVKAENSFGRLGMAKERIEVLVQVASALQSLGQYQAAMETLNRAMEIAQGSGDRRMAVLVLGRLGNGYLLTNRLSEAERTLTEALGLAEKERDLGLLASILNDTGNLSVLQKRYHRAMELYGEALGLSEKTDLPGLSGRIAANAARARLLEGNPVKAESYLDAAHRSHTALPDSHDRAHGLTGIGRMYRTMSLRLPERGRYFRDRASGALREAFDTARKIDDHRLASYASGYTGELKEDEGSFEDALIHTRRAIFEAQAAAAPESAYLWHWQAGRLMKTLGRMDEGTRAYRRAALTLQSIRHEFAGDCRIYNQLSYKDAIEPVFTGFVDLLLRQARLAADPVAAEPLILEATQAVELMRGAELQDYLQNTCVSPRRMGIGKSDLVRPGLAVVYFVPFDDRLAVIAGLPKGLTTLEMPPGKAFLTGEVRAFRHSLEKRTTREYLPRARRLHELLIGPLARELATQKVETVVVIPDGPLRTIPFAALHDGSDFLVRGYGVVTVPGLTFAEHTTGAPRGRMRALLAGLSDAVHGFPALPSVPQELNAVADLFPGKSLVNDAMSIAAVRKELETTPYTIVHVASHGEFSDNSAETYLLAWDGKVTMDTLERFMARTRYRREAVDLLTLSACQSGATNDRAALGLAGLSVQAGAKSALAGLWYVHDDATSELVSSFYHHLRRPGTSKAQALRQAQLSLLDGERYDHPSYWAPFLLVGDWW